MISMFGVKGFIVPFVAMNFLFFITKTFQRKLFVWVSTIFLMITFDSSLYYDFLVCTITVN